jgi:spermidine dehydrogenase
MSSKEDRSLGMNRRIPRRDFLNGVAIGITAAYAATKVSPAEAAAAPEAVQAVPASTDYPPARTGLRGQIAQAVDLYPKLREGAYAKFPALDVDTKEEYDLVVVGGGFSGMSAAHFWLKALGADQKVLILDNLDDIGGHARRNEFTYQGRTFIAPGGTLGISTTFPYSYTAKALIAELGIDVTRNAEFFNRDLQEKYKLGRGTFFDKEHFGEDKLVVGGAPRWAEFFAEAPISDGARKALNALYGKNPDYMAGMSQQEKVAKLATMSYQDYLLKFAKLPPEAIPLVSGGGGRNSKKIDTMPAFEAARAGGVGFDGLGLTFEPIIRISYNFHYPDGAASVARLLLARIVPAVFPGKPTMETISNARADYARLDEAGSPVRFRMGSMVVRVQHDGPVEVDPGGPPGSLTSPPAVRVAYVRDGKVHGVRARNCVLACHNTLIPALMPEIPQRQKDALSDMVKVPQLYTNVLIRRWTAFQKLGVSTIRGPHLFFSASLDVGSTVGGYRGVTTPDEPIVVHMTASPSKPELGLPRKKQLLAGQQELLSMTFADYERKVREQLARTLGPGGFDPATDILAITNNRWPYGYAYTYDTLSDPDVPPEQRPNVIGRQRFGVVTIANSDAGAAAFINQAIDEADRAVKELLVARGLT